MSPVGSTLADLSSDDAGQVRRLGGRNTRIGEGKSSLNGRREEWEKRSPQEGSREEWEKGSLLKNGRREVYNLGLPCSMM